MTFNVIQVQTTAIVSYTLHYAFSCVRFFLYVCALLRVSFNKLLHALLQLLSPKIKIILNIILFLYFNFSIIRVLSFCLFLKLFCSLSDVCFLNFLTFHALLCVSFLYLPALCHISQLSVHHILSYVLKIIPGHFYQFVIVIAGQLVQGEIQTLKNHVTRFSNIMKSHVTSANLM